MNTPAPHGWARHARTNHALRTIVDQAIAAVPEVGTQQAAAFMAAMGVPQEVALRTLTCPRQRRAAGPAGP